MYGNTEGATCAGALQAENGNYIIYGDMNIPQNDSDILVFELDDYGNSVWSYTYGSSNRETPKSIIHTIDGGYLLNCSIYSSPYWEYVDAALMKIDNAGILQWLKKYGTVQRDEGFSAVIQTDNGDFLAVGETGIFQAMWTDLWLFKSSQSGDSLWSKTYGGSGHEGAVNVLILPNEDYLIGGNSSSFSNGYSDYWLICIEGSPLGIKPSPPGSAPCMFLYLPCPNPFNHSTAISYKLQAASFMELKVYDIMGREVAQLVDEFKPAGSYEVVFDASELSSGIFFANLAAGGINRTEKLILIK